MTAAGCDDSFETQDEAERAEEECEIGDPSFKFRIVATAFGAYWNAVYGPMSARQLCDEDGLSDRDLDEWVTLAEVDAAQQGDFKNWESIQAANGTHSGSVSVR
jgi:hypothetical protein